MDRSPKLDLPTGLLNDRYSDFAHLNQGSFGTVFTALDNKSGSKVAIKCMPKPEAAKLDPSVPVDERSEELQIHSRIGNHPNVVRFIESFESATHLYIVLEYCHNGDLFEAIRHNDVPPDTDLVRRMMLQLIDAITYLHANGVYHRDLKPENIFLDADYNLKIGDFGLATMAAFPTEARVGSDRYMAPEQFAPPDAGYSSAQADVWALGICFINILFSYNPFNTPTMDDPFYREFVQNPQSIYDIFNNLSTEGFDVLSHCLAIKPEKRSLARARQAVEDAIAFTTEYEPVMPLDDVSATSGAFNWSEALARNPPLSGLATRVPSQCLGATKRVDSYRDSALGTSVATSGFDRFENRAVDIPSAVASVPAAGPLFSSMFSQQPAAGFSQSWADMLDDDYVPPVLVTPTSAGVSAAVAVPPSPSPVKPVLAPLDHRVESSAVADDDDDDDGVFSFDGPLASPLPSIREDASTTAGGPEYEPSTPRTSASAAAVSSPVTLTPASVPAAAAGATIITTPATPLPLQLLSPPARSPLEMEKWANLGERRRPRFSQPQWSKPTAVQKARSGTSTRPRRRSPMKTPVTSLRRSAMHPAAQPAENERDLNAPWRTVKHWRQSPASNSFLTPRSTRAGGISTVSNNVHSHTHNNHSTKSTTLHSGVGVSGAVFGSGVSSASPLSGVSSFASSGVRAKGGLRYGGADGGGGGGPGRLVKPDRRRLVGVSGVAGSIAGSPAPASTSALTSSLTGAAPAAALSSWRHPVDSSNAKPLAVNPWLRTMRRKTQAGFPLMCREQAGSRTSQHSGFGFQTCNILRL